MKKALFLVYMALVLPLSAQITVEVYEEDGVTLFDNRNIPVGTSLKLIIASDSNEFWSGGLFISDSDRDLGSLSGAGKEPNSLDWAGCHWEEAGPYAMVTDWEDSLIKGFDFYASECNSVPGNWFVVDYTALAPGNPDIGFYTYDVSWYEPNMLIPIHQVPVSDFNIDGAVNLADFAVLSMYWQQDDPCSSDWEIADLDADGAVDMNDLILFTDDWLWGVPIPDANQNDPNQGDPNQSDPNIVEPTPDPNMIYSIVDANGLNEITINVGDSVTLYVEMSNVNTSRLWSFGIEADLSDPNLGSIDNRAYDPNDPPGPGTARILAGPHRGEFFDNWGPGVQQEEGIYMSGVSSSGAFADGNLVSFVFTCQGAGDVEVNLINWDSTSTTGVLLYPTLEEILIHQVEPTESDGVMMMSSSLEGSMMLESESASMLSAELAEESVDAVNQEELVQFLNDIWIQDSSIQDLISEDEWNEFIESVKASY
jgi:hypothetical protein